MLNFQVKLILDDWTFRDKLKLKCRKFSAEKKRNTDIQAIILVQTAYNSK